MDNVGIQDNQTEVKEAAKLNPWISMLTKPRSTIQYIADNSPYKHFFILVFVCSIVAGIISTVEHPSTFTEAVFNIFLLSPLLMFLYIFAYAFLIWITGYLFNGKGNNKSIRAALAWSMMPFLWGIPLLTISIPLLLTFKIFWPYALSKLFIFLWSLTLYCQTILQIQGYKSFWQFLLNVTAANFIIIAAVYGLIIFLTTHRLL